MTLKIVHTATAYVVQNRDEELVIEQLREELDRRTLSAQILKTAFDREVEARIPAQIELTEARAKLMQMQLDANAVCQSLGVKWAADGNYPSFAVQAVGTLRGRAARGEWQRDKAQAELMQARAELADADTAMDAVQSLWRSPAEAQRQDTKLEQRTSSLDYWFKTCQAAERERDQIRKEAQGQSDEVQSHWLSPVEAEGLRRQLKDTEGRREYWYKEARDDEAETKGLRQRLAHTHNQLAAAQKAAEWLWGFYDGNTLVAKPGYEDDICEAWGKLLIAADSTPDAIQLQERLATLDATEAALADARRVARLWFRRAREPMVEVEIAGAEVVEALQAERKLRQEAEHRAEVLEREQNEWRVSWESVTADLLNTRKRLSEAELAAHVYDRSCGELAQTVHTERALRQEAETKAKNREAQLTLEVGRSNSLRLACQRAYQRAERAEALAALVTEKAAALLEGLGKDGWPGIVNKKAARELAAQIREVLDEH